MKWLLGLGRRPAAIPQPVETVLARANAARDAGDFLAAAALYARVAEQDPTNPAVHIQCGHMNKEAGRYELANTHYRAALDLTPDDPELNLQIGHFYKITGRTRDAIAAYQKAEHLVRGWQAPIAELAALDAPVASAVMMIDAFYPRPDRDAGSIVQIMYMKMFHCLGYKVFFAAHHELQLEGRYRQALEDMGVSCVEPSHKSAFEMVKAFLTEHAGEIAMCVLSRLEFGSNYMDTVRDACPNARIVFNPVDLHHLREQREAELNNDDVARARAHETRIRELTVVEKADATIVVSDYEAELLGGSVPDAVVVTIPLVHENVTDRIVQFSHRSGIGFIGGYKHLPNVDAVTFFLDQIWPRVRSSLPDAEFLVIGSDLPEELTSRTDPGVVWVGYVPDLDPWLARLRLTVAPLRYGAGSKGKVVSSLGRGVPCVVSPIAAEGMGLTAGVNVEVGRSPDEIAQLIVSLYTDASRWTMLSDAGVALVRQRYSFEFGVGLLRNLMTELALPVAKAG